MSDHKLPAKDERCCQLVSDGRCRPYQCQRRGVVTRDGKLYCKQHDPEAVAARRKASAAKWHAEWKEAQARHDAERTARAHADTCVGACTGLNPAAIPALVEAAARWEKATQPLIITDEPKVATYNHSEFVAACRELRAALAAVKGTLTRPAASGDRQ